MDSPVATQLRDTHGEPQLAPLGCTRPLARVNCHGGNLHSSQVRCSAMFVNAPGTGLGCATFRICQRHMRSSGHKIIETTFEKHNAIGHSKQHLKYKHKANMSSKQHLKSTTQICHSKQIETTFETTFETPVHSRALPYTLPGTPVHSRTH